MEEESLEVEGGEGRGANSAERCRTMERTSGCWGEREGGWRREEAGSGGVDRLPDMEQVE